MSRSTYIQKYRDAVVDATRGTELFPSVMMAQAILESGNGESLLAKAYNNHFGIKAGGGWTGKSVNLRTREVYEGRNVDTSGSFRVYDSALHSFRDRNRFLTENSHYAQAGVFVARQPETQAAALQRAGYATDPNYANTLIGLINRNGLKALDAQARRKGFFRLLAASGLLVGTCLGGFLYLNSQKLS